MAFDLVSLLLGLGAGVLLMLVFYSNPTKFEPEEWIARAKRLAG